MAGSQSFGKRENEKKKQAKRLEKQRSKEARRAEGTSSFEEMIAWVDEHGNLTDVPPEERARKAQEVKLEDIVISTPKKTEVEEAPLRGRVEYFTPRRATGSSRTSPRRKNISSISPPHRRKSRRAGR